MYLSHISIPIPAGGERAARDFYVKLLGLREIGEGEPLRATGRISLDAGGLELHLMFEQREGWNDPHFGLGCGDLEALKSRLLAAGLSVESPVTPARKFFTRDPFGNRLEIHVPGNFETTIESRFPSED